MISVVEIHSVLGLSGPSGFLVRVRVRTQLHVHGDVAAGLVEARR